MVKIFNHQKTIGIVGTTPDAHNFILKANQLGFVTYQLCQTHEEEKEWYGADKTFVGTLKDKHIQEDFLMKCDLLVYFDYSIPSTQLEEAQKSVVVPQGEDLLAIARDRVLQKAFKESLSVNLAPYKTIVKPEDIKDGIRSIGYPAVLYTNFSQLDAGIRSYFIYEESDIEQASQLLKYGTCVLESWIVAEHKLSVSIVKKASGHRQLFPIIKKNYGNERLSTVQKFTDGNQELINEIERVAKLIADNISYQGVATIDFIVSPAQALYIGDIYPYPNRLSRYSEGKGKNSITEAHLRAITSLPIPELNEEKTEFVYVPVYVDQKEVIDELITIYPNWTFVFYPIVKGGNIDKDKEVGHILIETEDVVKTLIGLKEFNI